ncbi:MAG TPA: nicotinate-nucleotide adenylyltransferase [Xanthobacteraceae bacterium]|jgi:nicotinate-nucleotide adenylyltransferase
MPVDVAQRAGPLPQHAREQTESAARLGASDRKLLVARRARGNVRLPAYSRGMRIGLFGGTFDPPHGAHLAACLIAMKRLRLDRVWWLVTPGNPLKDTRGLAPLEARIEAARKLTRHPRIAVLGLEAQIGTRYTYETIAYLRQHCPSVRFVWIMGADNLRSFHKWQKWRGIAALVPIAVIDRLGPSLYASAGAAGQFLARSRIPESAAKSLLDRNPPVWVYLHGLKSPLSSTALRAARVGLQSKRSIAS